MIRGKGGSAGPATPPGLPVGRDAPKTPANGRRPARRAAFGRKVTVGVDMHEGGLKLAAVRFISERRRELVRYTQVPLPAGIDPGGPAFVRFLRQELTAFCSGFGRFEIWKAISSLAVVARNVRIPKVPAKEIANAVYWGLKKDVTLDDARVVFDYEVIRTVRDNGTEKIEALAYTAPVEDVESPRQLFAKAGFPLTGVSIVPFGIQNLFRSRWIDNGQDAVCTLFIGRDWSRIDLFEGDALVLSRDVKTGQQSMVETLQEALEQAQAGDGEAQPPEADAEERARQIFDAFLAEDDQPRETAESILGHPVFQMIRPALDRVVRQVERTIQHYVLRSGEQTVRRIYISGHLGEHPALVDYIGGQVGLPIALIDPFPEGEAAIPLPATPSERGAFLPAVGMALSQQYQTPNFIFTYRHKDRQRYQRRLNRLVFSLFMAIMLACAGLLVWQGHRLDIEQRMVSQLQTEVDSYVPRVERNLLLQLAAKVHRREKDLSAHAHKHLAMVVVGELARHTPPAVRLTNIAVDTGSPLFGASAEVKRVMLIEGLVTGRRVELEPALADFMLRLDNSPLFTRPTIKQKVFENQRDRDVLRFSAQIDLA